MKSRATARRYFLEAYRKTFDHSQKQASLLERFIREILSNARIDVHKIESRAKEPDSLHLKLLRKGYSHPKSQLTDKIAARVITYYASDVDKVVDVLRPELEIDARNSVDKRRALGLRSFGYSSVHLIARLKEKYVRRHEYFSLSGLKVEIQVRSILEHAWAEIEHEVVLKSGVAYPKSVTRQFAAIAGALEFLGAGFHSLREERNKLIDHYKARFHKGLDRAAAFDSARLLAFLEISFPNNPGWRQAEQEEAPFPPRIEAVCVVALKSCRLGTQKALQSLAKTKSYKNAVKEYAAVLGIGTEQVSHLALVLIAITKRNLRVLRDYFPQLSQDPGLTAVAKK